MHAFVFVLLAAARILEAEKLAADQADGAFSRRGRADGALAFPVELENLVVLVGQREQARRAPRRLHQQNRLKIWAFGRSEKSSNSSERVIFNTFSLE